MFLQTLPACRRAQAKRVILHVTYMEQHYDTPVTCVRGIRELLALGWNLVELRGASNGPLLVVCRKEMDP